MIALIAHDGKKDALLDFVQDNLEVFARHQLVATGSTGRVLRDELGLEVVCVAHGPEGGDFVIGGMVVEGKISAVIFFRNPLTAQPHEPDVLGLLRVCDVHNVPLATNEGTAKAMLPWLAGFREPTLESSFGASVLFHPNHCDHAWVSAVNEVVKSGEICLKCNSIRAANNLISTE